MPWPDASYSTVKNVVKSSVARKGVVHIASLIFTKALVAT
jgi:hypothetical protein